MASPRRFLQNGSIYHLFNRGVDKRDTFQCYEDYWRFFLSILYYQQQETGGSFSHTDFKIDERHANQKFEIISFCLMPNHFHLMVKQKVDRGIERGMSDLQNSYTKYFNTKYDRVGALFQGKYKSILVADNEQYVHLARYIMINPFVSFVTDDLKNYPWSSYGEYFVENKYGVCVKQEALEMFSGDSTLFKAFIDNHKDFARTKESLVKLIID